MQYPVPRILLTLLNISISISTIIRRRHDIHHLNILPGRTTTIRKRHPTKFRAIIINRIIPRILIDRANLAYPMLLSFSLPQITTPISHHPQLHQVRSQLGLAQDILKYLLHQDRDLAQAHHHHPLSLPLMRQRLRQQRPATTAAPNFQKYPIF
jgi:hypothetical protein